MPRLSSILWSAAVLTVSASLAPAARITHFNRIGMNDPFGGSSFARSLHELSEQGKLNPQPPQLVIDRDYLDTYANLYSPCPSPYRYGYSYDYYYSNYPYRYPYPYGVDGRVRDGVQPASRMTTPPASAPANLTPPSSEPLTGLQSARRAFAGGDLKEAIIKYRAHVNDHPDDFAAVAELAAALVADGRLDDGIAAMRLAYGSDPGLASRPISDRVLVGKSAWRKIVVRAVRHGHKRQSASAWLTVAVLMQAEGRPRVALRMLERAEQAGLDRSLVSPLAAVLR